MNNNTILAIVFLMAGTLLTTTAVTIVPAAYAGNENEAEEDSNAALVDCDRNDVERAGFDCVAIAGDEEESGLMVAETETPNGMTTTTSLPTTLPDTTTDTNIMTNPLFTPP